MLSILLLYSIPVSSVLESCGICHWSCMSQTFKENINTVHAFLCFNVVRQWLNLPMSFIVTSLVLGQSYYCPSTSVVTLKDYFKSDYTKTSTENNTTWTVCIILVISCTCGLQYIKCSMCVAKYILMVQGKCWSQWLLNCLLTVISYLTSPWYMGI